MTQRKRNLIALFTLLFILGIAGWKGWQYYMGIKTAEYMAHMKTEVQAVVAKPQEWKTQIQASGTVNAVQGIMIKSQVAGNVTKIYFHSGQDVKAGDILLEINPGVLKANLVAAQAKADLMSGDYDRAVALFKRGALSKQDQDTALANKAAADAELQAVKAQLDQNIITAPITGKLGITQYNLGDYINIGQPLVNLQSIDTLRVDFSIPQNNANEVKPGDTVLVQTDSIPGEVFQGQVSAIDTAVNINTRTVAIRAEIPNPFQKLLPGSFAQITLNAGNANNYITIPQIAIIYDPNGNYVFKIINNKAIKTPIKILHENKQEVAVTGINNGEIIVTQGQLKIFDGANVHASY